MRSSVLRYVMVVLVLLVVVAGGVWIASSGSGRRVYTVGVLLPLGDRELAPIGRRIKALVERFSEEVVEPEELPWRLRFEFLDTGGDPAQVIRTMRSLLLSGKDVVAFIGPHISRTAIPAGGVAESLGIPLIAPIATHPAVVGGRQYVFRLVASDEFQARVLCRYAYERLGVRRMGVLFDGADDYSRDMAAQISRIFPVMGGEVVVEGFVSEEERREALERLVGHEPEGVVLPLFREQLVLAAGELEAAGYTGSLLGPDSWGTLTPEDRISGYWVTHWDFTFNDSPSSRFLERFLAERGEEPDVYVYFCDALFFLWESVKGLDLLSPEEVRNALTMKRGFVGALGSCVFLEDGEPWRHLYVMERLPGGRTVVRDSLDPVE
ncbi:ABC transporter substrate-binding protein [Spirochaeta thermophila]|uniref:Leucine-binding protein domain-containing protein n=1 Tax=Winmispira thermophila (strain ATCC 49972 / DSM 6192 / RI 19.B1) TaxID=665571 RepID=E0RNA8_WINT6|nr:ABC transporter substrate-binding protein [Spirochaeta thermophila]ADN01108.1 hypothetical protein STHERM_c01320 [Spirochaeta thermophila DSM 6192]